MANSPADQRRPRNKRCLQRRTINGAVEATRSVGSTIEYTDRRSTPRQTENRRVILARVHLLVNGLHSAASACYTKGGLGGSPCACWAKT